MIRKVCDDNKVNLKILQRALNSELKKRDLQIKVVQANGGQAAYDLYKQERPSVLFIDYHVRTEGLWVLLAGAICPCSFLLLYIGLIL